MDRKIGGGFTLKAGDRGEFRATFSTFGVIDHDGDVTLPGAFTAGQRVKIAAWNHDWQQPNPGVGVIDADDRRAWVDGRINLDTAAGRDLWSTLKLNGSEQQWSYGYRVLAWEPGMFEGQQVRFLKRLYVHECSPVFVAAGVGTYTETLKRSPAAAQHRMLLAIKAGLLRADIAGLDRQVRQLEEVAAIRAQLGKR